MPPDIESDVPLSAPILSSFPGFLWPARCLGGVYENLDGVQGPGLKEVLRWKFGRPPPDAEAEGGRDVDVFETPWNESPIEAASLPEGLACTWIGHATFLIEIGNFRLLTDPIFSDSCSPVPSSRLRRLRPPGVALQNLPPIDAVLLSHGHYDHLDLPSLRALGSKVPIFCPLGLGRLLRRHGLNPVAEMTWGDRADCGGGLRFFCLPAQHGYARTPFDRGRTLWCGWRVEWGGRSLHFLGDTGYFRFFREFASQPDYVPPDVALIPIGAYRPRWVMRVVHMSPEEAVRTHLDLRARLSIGMHYDTFMLADEQVGEASRDLRHALAQGGIPSGNFLLPPPGKRLSNEA